MNLVSLYLVSEQLCSMSNNMVNGKKHSPKELYCCLRSMFETSNFAIVILNLSGEDWLCEVSYNDDGEVSFFIPNTREQEDILYSRVIEMLKRIVGEE